jgi:hypothetical protein
MKRCVLCNKEGEFETTRTKTCNHCKELKVMKKASLAQKRKIERLEKKKQKTVGVVRLSDLKKKAQRVFNAWIRRRDENEPCISCQGIAVSGMQDTSGLKVLLEHSDTTRTTATSRG